MENNIKVIGYRLLSKEEIARMNVVKELAAKVGDLVHTMMLDGVSDPRWVAIARTELQLGFMSLTRAIAQPEFF